MTGVVYPSIATAQQPQYKAQANQYMADLRDNLMTEGHAKALASKMVEETKAGQAFVSKAADNGSWYSPPKGHLLDTYA